MTLKNAVDSIKSAEPALRELGVTSIAVFGSYARDEQSDDSDLDVLVGMRDDCGYFALARIKKRLQDALDVEVDVQFRETMPEAVVDAAVAVF